MLYALLILSTLAIVSLAYRTLTTLRHYKIVDISSESPLPEMPTVSVCIAVRNETHALAQCLERVLASDYAKLEVLVLDDSSDDGTSLIIKSFANAGVRFVPGKELPDGWLGKNHAYQTLIDEASGDVLLFIDVDTSIKPTTISQLVSLLVDSDVQMLSVLPRRDDGYRLSAIFGTMRYYWELLLGSNSSPPAASALWMVDAETLKTDGIGLANYGLSVRPERHMARQLTARNGYRYFIGTEKLGVSYEKHLHSQHETALRLYYPMTGRKLMNWLACSVYLSLLVAPLVIILSIQWDNLILTWSLLLVITVSATFGLFVRRTYSHLAWQLRIPLGPLLILQELGLLLISYVRYRRGTVTWKGRSIQAQPDRHDALKMSD